MEDLHLSHNTIRHKEGAIEHFLNWLKEHSMPPPTATNKMLQYAPCLCLGHCICGRGTLISAVTALRQIVIHPEQEVFRATPTTGFDISSIKVATNRLLTRNDETEAKPVLRAQLEKVHTALPRGEKHIAKSYPSKEDSAEKA